MDLNKELCEDISFIRKLWISSLCPLYQSVSYIETYHLILTENRLTGFYVNKGDQHFVCLFK